MMGVGHLGSTQSGGSAFYSYHWDPSVVTMARASWYTCLSCLDDVVYLFFIVEFFRSDIPIMIVPMISLVDRDVMRRG